MSDAPGLIERIEAATAMSKASGALLSIPTTSATLTGGGIEFAVRIAGNLARKDRHLAAAIAGRAPEGAQQDPFLPYDERLFVCDIGDRHVGLLNKFNVVDGHLLVVTRQFEHQSCLPTRSDLAALWTCLREVDGLGFYNAGAEAGASQAHRHLQLVGLPLFEGGARFPLEAEFARAVRALPEGAVTSCPALPCRNALARMPARLERDPAAAAQVSHSAMRRALEACGLNPATDPEGAPQLGPYNLIVTREILLAVPRSREHFGTVSLNALAFAGSFFVRDEAQLDMLCSAGPMAALKAVGTATVTNQNSDDFKATTPTPGATNPACT